METASILVAFCVVVVVFSENCWAYLGRCTDRGCLCELTPRSRTFPEPCAVINFGIGCQNPSAPPEVAHDWPGKPRDVKVTIGEHPQYDHHELVTVSFKPPDGYTRQFFKGALLSIQQLDGAMNEDVVCLRFYFSRINWMNRSLETTISVDLRDPLVTKPLRKNHRYVLRVVSLPVSIPHAHSDQGSEIISFEVKRPS